VIASRIQRILAPARSGRIRTQRPSSRTANCKAAPFETTLRAARDELSHRNATAIVVDRFTLLVFLTHTSVSSNCMVRQCSTSTVVLFS
jgi:hypothetical protein